MANHPNNPQSETVPFWRDGRVLGVLAQIIFVVLIVLFGRWLINNTLTNLKTLNSQLFCADGSIRCMFDFLQQDAQFAISESPIPYEPTDSYKQAVLVGVANTIKVSVLGIVLATILGTLVGIARLSPNWLVSQITKWYIDLMRNTPLVLQLLFLAVVLRFLPDVKEALSLFGLPIYLSQRGMNYPSLVFMPSFATWLAFIVLAVIQVQVLWVILGRWEEQSGRDTNRFLWVILSALFILAIGWQVSGVYADNQAFMVAKADRVREFGDLEDLALRQFGVNRLEEIEEAIAAGELSEEEVEELSLKVCTLADSPSQINFTAQLQSMNIPYQVVKSDRPDQAIEDYAADECQLFVAPRAILAGVVSGLEDSGNQFIVSVPERPVRISIPRLEGFNYAGGSEITPQFAAALLGLVIYTGAFIAELVRAGILSVSRGQSEAARALGLTESQRLRLIVLPQALRVIIPPLTSQYLNLAKNSSLAQFVAFPELWTVSYTIGNQSGQNLQVVLIVMATYLTVSILISALLNWYNQKVALVER